MSFHPTGFTPRSDRLVKQLLSINFTKWLHLSGLSWYITEIVYETGPILELSLFTALSL